MQALTFLDGGSQLTEHSEPILDPRSVLVRMEAAGINGADIAQAAGHYPPPPGVTSIPGLEVAGTVRAVGSRCRRFSLGDRVMAVVQGGAHADLCLVDEELLVPIPDVVSMVQAGGLLEVFSTAHDALFTQSGLSSGERVLIRGAAGGVGTAAIQLAVAAGAHVTASARNTAAHDALQALGATPCKPAAVADLGPFDVILELVGAPNWQSNIGALAEEGRICVIGVPGGTAVDLDLLSIMLKRARISASTLRARSVEDRAVVARLVEKHVIPHFADGRFAVPVEATFPLQEAAQAYRRFSQGNKFGKIVLTARTSG